MSSRTELFVIEAGAERANRQLPGALIVGSVMLLAAAAGGATAGGRISVGLAIVVASAYLLLVFLDISLAIAAWVALLFFSQWAALGRETTLIGFLVVLAWLGAGGVRRRRLPVLSSHGGLVVAIVLFASWLVLSAAWASAPEKSLVATRDWLAAILVFVVIATSLASSRDIAYVALAFVGGAALVVLLGFVGIGTIYVDQTSAEDAGRLQAAGDPNYQAAAFVAAIFIAGGLMAVFRRPAARLLLLVTLAVVTVGFFATQSRGGLVALGVALVAAVILFRRQRRAILGLASIGVLSLVIWLPTRPEVLHRLTSFGGGGGGGRADLWTVAWRVFTEHPVTGVGLGNFKALEARYVLEPGAITHVQLISETPNVVHNAYLGLMADTGIVGLICFCAVALGSLHASRQAARRFDAIGAFDQGNLARAVLAGTIGMLAAMFFISNASDFRLWVLFALGAVLDTVAKRRTSEAEQGGLTSAGDSRPTAPRGPSGPQLHDRLIVLPTALRLALRGGARRRSTPDRHAPPFAHLGSEPSAAPS